MQATFFFSFYYYSGSFLWSATRMITKPFAPRTSRTSCTTWPFLLKEEVLTNPRSKLWEPHCLKISKKVSFNKLRLHLGWTKVHWICQKWSIWRFFRKSEACRQTVLPNRPTWIGQKFGRKVPKLKNSDATFWWFSTNVNPPLPFLLLSSHFGGFPPKKWSDG